MKKFDDNILPHLRRNNIRYQDAGAAKSMSVDYFRKNFKEVATTELQHIGQYSYYYQSIENPELVLHFRVSNTAGVATKLMLYNDFKKKLNKLNNL